VQEITSKCEVAGLSKGPHCSGHHRRSCSGCFWERVVNLPSTHLSF